MNTFDVACDQPEEATCIVIFEGGLFDGHSLTLKCLTPPNEHWWLCKDATFPHLVGTGTAGPGYMPGRQHSDPSTEWIVYHRVGHDAVTVVHDRPVWRYLFAGVARASPLPIPPTSG